MAVELGAGRGGRVGTKSRGAVHDAQGLVAEGARQSVPALEVESDAVLVVSQAQLGAGPSIPPGGEALGRPGEAVGCVVDVRWFGLGLQQCGQKAPTDEVALDGEIEVARVLGPADASVAKQVTEVSAAGRVLDGQEWAVEPNPAGGRALRADPGEPDETGPLAQSQDQSFELVVEVVSGDQEEGVFSRGSIGRPSGPLPPCPRPFVALPVEAFEAQKLQGAVAQGPRRRLDAAVFSAVGFGDLHGAMDEGESRVGHRRAMGEGVAEEFVAGGFRLDRGIGEEPPSRGLGGSASNPFCRSGPIP